MWRREVEEEKQKNERQVGKTVIHSTWYRFMIYQVLPLSIP
jgi:hypothetical protein